MSDLDDLPPLREIIADHGLSAQKSLGQNFVLDQNITDKIARIALEHHPAPEDLHVFEIGPGPGGLTRSLLKWPIKSLTAIEFDPRAVEALQSLKQASSGRLTLIHGDAMNHDFIELSDAPRAVIANLPYNIATPLIISWLKTLHDNPNSYDLLAVMVQREVADRMSSKFGTKSYGRLSIITQFICDTQILYNLPPSAFTPPPKVDSAIIRLMPKKHKTNKTEGRPSFKTLETVTGAAFQQRRKMIRSSMKAYLPIIEEMGLDPTLRADALSVETYIEIARRAYD
jgi:16S rRNA (adenine1518-N6/adenine1519-N6)-dimethyltransferase